ncbi:MAG: FHA domain-containing protein [Anaerolineae bacterium]
MSDQSPQQDKPEFELGDSFETQNLSTDFEFEDTVSRFSEMDTRPAMPGQRRTIRLYIPQEVEPLVFFNPERLVIGRGGEGISLDVNVSEQYGWMLGVSREHAEIIYDMGLYYLADLDSTNGTFLNSSRLRPFERYPLESSDQIRMGHFLMIVAIP